jgi:hypothetical protein
MIPVDLSIENMHSTQQITLTHCVLDQQLATEPLRVLVRAVQVLQYR